MLRVMCGKLCGDLCHLAEYENFLQATDALCVNGLAGSLLAAGSAASKTSEDFGHSFGFPMSR